MLAFVGLGLAARGLEALAQFLRQCDEQESAETHEARICVAGLVGLFGEALAERPEIDAKDDDVGRERAPSDALAEGPWAAHWMTPRNEMICQPAFTNSAATMLASSTLAIRKPLKPISSPAIESSTPVESV